MASPLTLGAPFHGGSDHGLTLHFGGLELGRGCRATGGYPQRLGERLAEEGRGCSSTGCDGPAQTCYHPWRELGGFFAISVSWPLERV
jgi:hypothetical protein